MYSFYISLLSFQCNFWREKKKIKASALSAVLDYKSKSFKKKKQLILEHMYFHWDIIPYHKQFYLECEFLD
jgi:hypothetical protein